jgi:hypothetical protein
MSAVPMLAMSCGTNDSGVVCVVDDDSSRCAALERLCSTTALDSCESARRVL